MQLAARSETLWRENPNEFVVEEDDEGCPLGARSAGVALIRDMCDAFPGKVSLERFLLPVACQSPSYSQMRLVTVATCRSARVSKPRPYGEVWCSLFCEASPGQRLDSLQSTTCLRADACCESETRSMR